MNPQPLKMRLLSSRCGYFLILAYLYSNWSLELIRCL